jgi:hypothetical protein
MKSSFYCIDSSRLVKTKLLKEVEQKLQASLQPYSFTQNTHNYQEMLTLWNSLAEHSYIWLEKVIPNIRELKYIYFTNGITGALNLLASLDDIALLRGDYHWLNLLKPNSHYGHINEIPKNKIIYLSQPFAADGNIFNLNKILSESSHQLLIDGAYIGSASEEVTFSLPNNTKYFTFSLSKAFGLGSVRAGLLFSSTPIDALEKLHQAAYLPQFKLEIMSCIFNNFSPFYLHQTLHQLQKDVCNHLEIEQSHSVILGYTSDDKYKKWQRDNGVSRISLTPYFAQHTPNLFAV